MSGPRSRVAVSARRRETREGRSRARAGARPVRSRATQATTGATTSDVDGYRSNRLLGSLPGEALARIEPDITMVELPRGSVVYGPGEPVNWVFFPVAGVTSMIGTDDAGAGVDVALVGRDGILGAHAALASTTLPMETVQHIRGTAARMTAASFRRITEREPALRRAVARYLAVLFVETAQGAACNRLHGLEPRVSRWLLMTADRAAAEDLAMTHEGLARMAGASRPKVSQAVNALVASGAIETRRGWMRITDRRRLETHSCDCYAIIRDAWARMTSA